MRKLFVQKISATQKMPTMPVPKKKMVRAMAAPGTCAKPPFRVMDCMI